jgi:hypothetical protein
MTRQDIEHITRKIIKEYEGVDLRIEYKTLKSDSANLLGSVLNLSAWIPGVEIQDDITEKKLKQTILDMIAAEMYHIELKIKAMREIHTDMTKELHG